MEPIIYNIILSNGRCTFSPDPAQTDQPVSSDSADANVSRDPGLIPETLLSDRQCLNCNEIKLTFADGKEAPVQLAYCKHAICHDCKSDSSAIETHFQTQHPEQDIRKETESIDEETKEQLGNLMVTCADKGCTTTSRLSAIEQHIDEFHRPAHAGEDSAPEQLDSKTDGKETVQPAAVEQQKKEPIDPIEQALGNPEHVFCKMLTSIKAEVDLAARTVLKGDASYLSDTDNPYLEEKFKRDVLSQMQVTTTPKPPTALAPPPPPPSTATSNSIWLKKSGSNVTNHIEKRQKRGHNGNR